MNKKFLILCCLFSLLGFSEAIGQGGTPEFNVSISADTAWMYNAFEVSFILKNAEGSQFSPPEFASFNVLSGPSRSSSMSIINGAVSQSTTYTYYIEPLEPGQFYIEPASIATGEGILETQPMEIWVQSNPDRITQPRKRQEDGFFRSFDDFFNQPMPDFFEPAPNPNQPKKKKKRKTVRI